MDFVGKLILALPIEEGTSRAGNPWRKKTWVAETFGQYPRKVAMQAMNSAIDNLGNLQIGKVYTFSIDVESREYNGKWYTDARVFRASETTDPNNTFAQPGAPTQSPFPQAAPMAQAASMAGDPFASRQGAPGASAFENSNDDLPF